MDAPDIEQADYSDLSPMSFQQRRKMHDDLDIEQAVSQIETLFTMYLGTVFSCWDAAVWLAQYRQRRLVVIERTIDVNHFGLAFAFLDFDLIIIVPGLGEALFALVFFHELVHVLRQDAQVIPKTFAQFEEHTLRELLTAPPLLCAVQQFYHHLPVEHQKKERVAARAAARLVSYDRKQHTMTPRSATMVFGYRDGG